MVQAILRCMTKFTMEEKTCPIVDITPMSDTLYRWRIWR